MCDGQQNEWFRQWFDSPYYHILYRHRDQQEADTFLEKILIHLHLPHDADILDLACGKGRHSIFLHSKGYNVTGVDLSSESIAEASRSENETLHFETQDMRTLHLGKKFDCIMNLFTSFGYFKGPDENKSVLTKVKEHLKPSGLFVLDYFNAERVKQQIKPCHEMRCGDISFDITKKIVDGQILKNITVRDGMKVFHFMECVQLLTMDDIAIMLQQIGMTPVATFGDYMLNPFVTETSERSIIIARY